MPIITRSLTRSFHRSLFTGKLETITLRKRGDNQQQGTVTDYTLNECRHGMIWKTGETIGGDMVSDHKTTWHIPRAELDRVGVAYLNSTDRIVDNQGRVWQPESDTLITVKLLEGHVDVDCKRVS